MGLRDRLLFIFIPLVVLPVVLQLFFFLFILKQAGAHMPGYEIVSVLFVVGVVVAAIVIVGGASKSISKPLVRLIEETQKIAEGNLEIIAKPIFQSTELNHLSLSIEKLKNDLKRHQEMLQEQAAHAAVGKVAAHVAHDLAGPLSSMQAALAYFRQLQVSDPRAPDYVNLLELSTIRLKGVSKELLDLHKGEEPHKILFSLHKLLDELLGEYQSSDDYRSVTFVKRYASQAISIYAERAKIQRVFGNLIKNAIEAMDKVGCLTVTARNDGSFAVIEIEDDGSGMPPDILKRVMSEGMTHGKADGHGIGMKVVRDTVGEHGGAVTARSDVGVGTVFTIRLPLPESVQIKEVAKEDGIVERFEIALAPNEPLLVVDDDIALLEQWRLEMERLGRTTLSCTSYEDFLEKGIGSRLTTTAVVDYHFENSEMKGTEVIQKLKEQGFQRLYLCTAEYWKPSVQKSAADLGITICPKPLPKVVICHPERSEGSLDSSPMAQNDKDLTVLLIDDDPSIRKTWSVLQTTLGIGTLHSFPTLEAFIQSNIAPNLCDLCVIDKNIEGSDYDGARMLNYLKEKGAPRVLLATGEQEAAIRNDPAYAGIDGILSEKVPMSLEKYLN